MSNPQKTENLTGAGKKEGLRVAFDRRVKLEFHGTQVTSDAGLLAYRELDEALGLTVQAEELLNDLRTGKNTQHSMVALLRQSLYSRLAGYEDTNDAERLAVDPAMRQVVGGRATERAAASTSQMGRFETEVLTQPKNLKALNKLLGHWIDRLQEHRAMRDLTLDLDSSVSETYGEQEGTAYNGHFSCTCGGAESTVPNYSSIHRPPAPARRGQWMKEKQMKTSVNMGAVSLPPAEGAGWGVKDCAKHGGSSEKHGFGVEKWLVKQRNGRIVTKTTGKTQFEP